MAVLALSAIGAAVGSWAVPGTILGMSGAGFGWMVGSMAGSLLFPPKAPDGPRLEDRAVQVSTYGQPIPRIYGADRTAGNVIWSTDLQETEHEQGKGGPSYSTYTYSVSFAAAICQGPIVGVRKMWADGKLIYDVSEQNIGVQEGFTAESLAIYVGDETQLPDPTIQAIKGDTPAYRGLAYVVFCNLQLEKFGNRIPSLSFEVVQAGTSDARNSDLIIPRPVEETGTSANAVTDPDTGYVWSTSSNSVIVYDPVSLRVVRVIPSASALTQRIEFCPSNRTVWVCGTSVFSNVLRVYSADSFALLHEQAAPAGTLTTFCPVTGEMGFGSTYAINANTAWMNVADYSTTTLDVEVGFLWDGVFVTDYNHLVLTGNSALVVILVDVFSKVVILREALPGAVMASPGTDIITYDSRRKLVYRLGGASGAAAAEVHVYDPSSVNVSVVSLSGTASTLSSIHYHAPSDLLLVSQNGGSLVYAVDPDTFAVKKTISNGGGSLLSMTDALNLSDRVWGSATPGVSVIYLGDIIYPSTVPLSDVVLSESGLAGLAPADIDASALAPIGVAGFSVAGGSVRSGIEQLMMAYQFDAVESGGVVKFVRRGGAVVATLDDTDLAAHQPGNEVPTPLALTRAEEVELPQRITVRYPNPNADYQTGAQSAQRLTGRAMAQQGVDLPIVLTDSQALQIAEAALYSAWTARTSTSFTTTLKHADLEPTDVIVAGGNTLRITRRMENAGLLTFDAAFENGNVFTQAALGAPSDIPLQTIPLRSRTALEFLDLPPLRDQDDDAGYYLAASGYTSGWDGALVFKSADGGVSYEELVLLPSAATVGSAIDALGTWPEQNTFDEANTVTIVLRSGSLSSLSETAVLNGGNAALLGSEIIQFKNATLNADGSYTLHGLLRGRKATPTGGHVAGDRFVLLNTSTLRRAAPVASEVGLERLYKGVSIGATLASATAKDFTNTAQALEPLAPVHLGGGRSAAGDVAITWKRRTRIGGAWRDYADVPLSEASESYEVDVFADGTYAVLKRTIASASTSLTYTAAQQTTDFGSTQSTVYCRVYQLSATNGRGTALQGTV